MPMLGTRLASWRNPMVAANRLAKPVAAIPALALSIPLIGAAFVGAIPAMAADPTITVCTSDTAIYYPDFSDAAELTLNGLASIPDEPDPSLLRLTSADGDDGAGSAFTEVNLPADGAFHTEFVFTFSGDDDPLSDGLTFTLQSDGPEALGWGGGGLGYLYDFSPSVAVQFVSYVHNAVRIADSIDTWGAVAECWARRNRHRPHRTGDALRLDRLRRDHPRGPRRGQ